MNSSLLTVQVVSLFECIDEEMKCVLLQDDIEGNDGTNRIEECFSTHVGIEKIILVSNVNCDDVMNDRIERDGEIFELRLCASTFNEVNGRFEGDVFSRHGDSFTSWWFKSRGESLHLQSVCGPSLQPNRSYTVVYVRLDHLNLEATRNELLVLQGGQSHVQCRTHKMPLIRSREKRKCSICKRWKEHLCCNHPFCLTNICKKCFHNKDKSIINFISHQGQINVELPEDEETLIDEEELDEGIVEDTNSDILDNEVNPMYDFGEDLLGMTHPPDIEDDEVSERSSDQFNYGSIFATNENIDPLIDTTNAADELIEVQAQTDYGGPNNEFIITGSGLLCETTSILTRQRHDIQGTKSEKHFVQRFCATTKGTSFPLLYPESAMFPSIFWSDAKDTYSIAGALPSHLLSGYCKEDGFSDLPKQIRSRITSPLSSTSSSPNYLIFCHDLLCSVAANHNDLRQHGKGMTSANDAVGGLDLRRKEDSNFLHSIDSRQMVKNLCASQEFFPWDIFLTFTCNMRKHFGTRPIREWLDNDEWKQYYPKWEIIAPHHQKEIEMALIEAAAGLFLRVWEEVSSIFIDYLKNSKSSPFTSLISMFARKEYQADAGNLSHIHFLGKLVFEMSPDDKQKLLDLIRNNVIDIVRPDDIEKLIQEGYIKHEDDAIEVQNDGNTYLIHHCNARCLVPDSNGILRCRVNNFRMSQDNTRQSFIALPNEFSDTCLKRLEISGLAALERNEDGEIVSFQSELDYFHPKKHIPPWKPGDKNISPCETKTFCVCRSMQNVQWLSGAGGSCKYCCKYVAKIDKNNYMSVSTASDGRLIRRGNLLHNTKRVTSEIVQHKERESKRSWRHPQGNVISLNEIRHHILQYPEVITDLRFVSIPTTSLELRSGSTVRNADATSRNQDTNDNNYNPNNVRLQMQLQQHRLFSQAQVETARDMALYKASSKLDKITQFSLRPPELMIFDMVGKYFRWFDIGSKALKDSVIYEFLDEDIYQSTWIDASKNQIMIRKKAIPELLSWLDSIIVDENNERTMETIQFFQILYHVTHSDKESLDDDETYFYEYAMSSLVCEYDDGYDNHLPIPVYTYIKPSMGTQFLLHIMLSMGRFSTERELLLQPTIRDNLRSAKLIGTQGDSASLASYSNGLFFNFVKKQLQWYPNGQRIIENWLIQAGDLFDGVIINNQIPITDMPPLQLSTLLQEKNEAFENCKNKLKEDLILASFRELGDAVDRCNIPTHNELFQATLSEPVAWDPVATFARSPSQSEESFQEQLSAIKVCIKSIDDYMDVMNSA